MTSFEFALNELSILAERCLTEDAETVMHEIDRYLHQASPNLNAMEFELKRYINNAACYRAMLYNINQVFLNYGDDKTCSSSMQPTLTIDNVYLAQAISLDDVDMFSLLMTHIFQNQPYTPPALFTSSDADRSLGLVVDRYQLPLTAYVVYKGAVNCYSCMQATGWINSYDPDQCKELYFDERDIQIDNKYFALLSRNNDMYRLVVENEDHAQGVYSDYFTMIATYNNVLINEVLQTHGILFNDEYDDTHYLMLLLRECIIRHNFTAFIILYNNEIDDEFKLCLVKTAAEHGSFTIMRYVIETLDPNTDIDPSIFNDAKYEIRNDVIPFLRAIDDDDAATFMLIANSTRLHKIFRDTRIIYNNNGLLFHAAMRGSVRIFTKLIENDSEFYKTLFVDCIFDEYTCYQTIGYKVCVLKNPALFEAFVTRLPPELLCDENIAVDNIQLTDELRQRLSFDDIICEGIHYTIPELLNYIREHYSNNQCVTENVIAMIGIFTQLTDN